MHCFAKTTKASASYSPRTSVPNQGGISNGMPIHFRLAFKPPATIGRAQNTATFAGEVPLKALVFFYSAEELLCSSMCMLTVTSGSVKRCSVRRAFGSLVSLLLPLTHTFAIHSSVSPRLHAPFLRTDPHQLRPGDYIHTKPLTMPLPLPSIVSLITTTSTSHSNSPISRIYFPS